MNNLQRDLGRVEGKLDALVSTLTAYISRADDKTGDIEKRLAKVEGKQHWYAGIAAAIVGLISNFHWIIPYIR